MYGFVQDGYCTVLSRAELWTGHEKTWFLPQSSHISLTLSKRCALSWISSVQLKRKRGWFLGPFLPLLLLLLSHFSRVWLCNPIDGSPLGSSVAGILQARILEWVAISFSNASTSERQQFLKLFYWFATCLSTMSAHSAWHLYSSSIARISYWQRVL